MAQERKESSLVIPPGMSEATAKLLARSQLINAMTLPANYKGLERLLWYIYDRRVSRIEAARLIHTYTVAWADAREKARQEIAGSSESSSTADSNRGCDAPATTA